MKSLSEEQLIALAKKGDGDATNELLSRYKIYAKKLSRSYYVVGGDSEDVMQEAMIGVFNAIKDYNGESSFKSFVFLCVKRQILSAIKKSGAQKNKPLSNFIPLVEENENGAERLEIIANVESLSPEDSVINDEAGQELINNVKNSLSAFEYEILTAFLGGFSYAEIAEQMHVTVKAVDNALSRIRKKLAKYL